MIVAGRSVATPFLDMFLLPWILEQAVTAAVTPSNPMKFTPIVLACAVLTGPLFAQPERARFEESLRMKADILPLKKDANRSVYAVEVQFNSKPLWMVVDCTADSLTLSTEAAKAANVPLKEATVGPPGQAVPMMVGPVESFLLGKAKVTSEAMPFMSYSRMGNLMIDGVAQPTGGQLGLAVLKSLKVVADFSKTRLLVPSMEFEGGLGGLYDIAKFPSLALVESNNRLLVPATLQGKEIYLLCSSGTRVTSLTQAVVTEMGLTMQEAKDGKPAMAKVPELKIGDLELKDAGLRVTTDVVGSVDGKPIAGVLGVDLMEASKIIIAFGENRLFFDAPAQ